MDQIVDFRSLRRTAPVAAALAGVAVALLVAVMPAWRLEAVVTSSGIAGHLAAARPPLGATARSVLALASGVGIALAGWAVLTFAARLAGGDAPAGEPDAPVLRRADAHPDAPARRPLRASEDLAPRADEDLARIFQPPSGGPLPIGAPSPSPLDANLAERISPREVPVDLDTPLAAVDPAAIPDVPREPIRPVAPLARPACEERIETFELTPIRRSRPEPASRAPVPTSLSALLDRLEHSAAGRAAHPGPPLSETLGMLRGLATR